MTATEVEVKEVKLQELTPDQKLACKCEEYAQGLDTEAAAAVGVDGVSGCANPGFFLGNVAALLRDCARRILEKTPEFVPPAPPEVKPPAPEPTKKK